MTTTELLVRQTKDAHSWTNRLIDSVPEAHWEETPDILASNISWQVGHVLLSEYYHAIMVIVGFDSEIMEKIDLKALNQHYGYDSKPAEAVGIRKPKWLKEHLLFMQNKVIHTITGLSDENLESKVERPIAQEHPVAKTKLEAVSWNIKHTMWHCGQIASIKRTIHGGYDYGLPRRN